MKNKLELIKKTDIIGEVWYHIKYNDIFIISNKSEEKIKEDYEKIKERIDKFGGEKIETIETFEK